MMGNTWRMVHCEKCKRDLIAPAIDGWTGKEIPRKDFYLCDNCKREQERKQAQLSENAKIFEKMFANYARDSKCKRGHAIPCEICKAVFNENCGV